MRFLIIFICCLGLLGCSAQKKDKEEAQKQVEHFHYLMDAEDFRTIYQESSYEEVKKKHSEKEFVEILKKVRQSVGKFKSSKLLGSKVTDYVVGATRVGFSYQTQYSLMEVTETFWFEKTDTGFVLMQFNIDSLHHE